MKQTGIKNSYEPTVIANQFVKSIFSFEDKTYITKLAETKEELTATQKLRFEVFNLELNEGLNSSYHNSLDEDQYDTQCHHVIVIAKSTNKVIGTYRIQTYEMANEGIGFYCANEFQISELGQEILKDSAEVGRACIAQNHRNNRVLYMLWKGILNYVLLYNKRYLFGCCAIKSQDASVGFDFYNHLKEKGHLHKKHMLKVMPDYECITSDDYYYKKNVTKIPLQMEIYLRYYSKVCSYPSIDREFKTIDFLVLLDLNDADREIYERFLN